MNIGIKCWLFELILKSCFFYRRKSPLNRYTFYKNPLFLFVL